MVDAEKRTKLKPTLIFGVLLVSLLKRFTQPVVTGTSISQNHNRKLLLRHCVFVCEHERVCVQLTQKQA